MKQLLYIAAICLILASCDKKAPAPILALPTTIAAAFDSMNISTDTFYHVVMKRNNVSDSSAVIRFLSSSKFTEYFTTTDTNGIHYWDSLTYVAGSTYSEYQAPDPANYAHTIGYIFTDYYPIGGSSAKQDTFNFHNYLVHDTLHLSIGIPPTYYLPTGAFKGPQPDSPKVIVTFYK